MGPPPLTAPPPQPGSPSPPRPRTPRKRRRPTRRTSEEEEEEEQGRKRAGGAGPAAPPRCPPAPCPAWSAPRAPPPPPRSVQRGDTSGGWGGLEPLDLGGRVPNAQSPWIWGQCFMGMGTAIPASPRLGSGSLRGLFLFPSGGSLHPLSSVWGFWGASVPPSTRFGVPPHRTASSPPAPRAAGTPRCWTGPAWARAPCRTARTGGDPSPQHPQTPFLPGGSHLSAGDHHNSPWGGPRGLRGGPQGAGMGLGAG